MNKQFKSAYNCQMVPLAVNHNYTKWNNYRQQTTNSKSIYHVKEHKLRKLIICVLRD